MERLPAGRRGRVALGATPKTYHAPNRARVPDTRPRTQYIRCKKATKTCPHQRKHPKTTQRQETPQTPTNQIEHKNEKPQLTTPPYPKRNPPGHTPKPATTSNNHKTAGRNVAVERVGGNPPTSTHGRRPRQRPFFSPGEFQFERWAVNAFEVWAVSSTFLGFVLGVWCGLGWGWLSVLGRLRCWWGCCMGLCCLYGYELGAAR